jgi:hypothetical protein
MAVTALQPCVLCRHPEVGIVGVHQRRDEIVCYALCLDCADRSSVLEEVESVIAA